MDSSDVAGTVGDFIRGLAYYELQHCERAIAGYGRAIELDAEYAGARHNTVCAYALMGQIKQACERLEKAIGLDENCRRDARTDEDLEGIRKDRTFRELVGRPAGPALLPPFLLVSLGSAQQATARLRASSRSQDTADLVDTTTASVLN